MPRAVGTWETTTKVGDREYTATLVIKADEEGKLTGKWQSQWGDHVIKEMAFKQGNLTFTRQSKVQEREWESAFEGTVKKVNLSGTFESERGTIAVEGKRSGAALIGKWELTIISDSGTRTQILQVNPDLNVKLIPQLEKLKPGSRIVSHDFDMKGIKPDKVVTVGSDNQYEEHTIHFWTTPLKREVVSSSE